MPDPIISPHERALGQHLASITAAEPRFIQYWDAEETLSVHIAKLKDWPRDGVNCCLTVGLTVRPLGFGGDEYEVLAVASKRWIDLAQIVGDAGIHAQARDVIPDPGMVWYDYMAPTYEGLQVRHLLVTDPLDPALRLTGPPESKPPVRWLQMIPITDGELKILEGVGLPQFLGMLTERNVVVEDFGRMGMT